jgi:ribose transport system substrate-binding protein
MFKGILTSFFSLVVLLSSSFLAHAQAKKPKIGFLPGVVDPFYQVMEVGINEAAADFSLEVVTQYPQTWGPTIQTPILDAMIGRGDLKYLIIAPDKEQMIAPLQRAVDAGIKVITVDTFLGDGDYVNGKVTFPIS